MNIIIVDHLPTGLLSNRQVGARKRLKNIRLCNLIDDFMHIT